MGIFVIAVAWFILYSLSNIEKNLHVLGYTISGFSFLLFLCEILDWFNGRGIDRSSILTTILFTVAGIIGHIMRERWLEDKRKKIANRPYLEEKMRLRHEEIQREKQQKECETQELQRIEELKKKVETKAMDIAIEYEKSNYRTPSDVSSQNLGYDIKSSSKNETRFIEVKGKSDIDSIQLTENEWNKAKELENNYYLYVVYNCLGEPRLKRVRNPANKLSANNDYKTGKYSIDKYEIDKYSE